MTTLITAAKENYSLYSNHNYSSVTLSSILSGRKTVQNSRYGKISVTYGTHDRCVMGTSEYHEKGLYFDHGIILIKPWNLQQ